MWINKLRRGAIEKKTDKWCSMLCVCRAQFILGKCKNYTNISYFTFISSTKRYAEKCLSFLIEYFWIPSQHVSTWVPPHISCILISIAWLPLNHWFVAEDLHNPRRRMIWPDNAGNGCSCHIAPAKLRNRALPDKLLAHVARPELYSIIIPRFICTSPANPHNYLGSNTFRLYQNSNIGGLTCH